MRSRLLVVAMAASLGMSSFVAVAAPAQDQTTNPASTSELEQMKAQLAALQAKVDSMEQQQRAAPQVSVSSSLSASDERQAFQAREDRQQHLGVGQDVLRLHQHQPEEQRYRQDRAIGHRHRREALLPDRRPQVQRHLVGQPDHRLQLRQQRRRDQPVRQEGLRGGQVRPGLRAARRFGRHALDPVRRELLRLPLRREHADRSPEVRQLGRLGPARRR